RFQLLYGTRKTHGTAVRPVSGHRINGVSDHDDARAERYIVAHHAVGVSRSVEILVMVPNHGLDRSPNPCRSVDELRTPDYVSRHYHPLFRTQLAFYYNRHYQLFE